MLIVFPKSFKNVNQGTLPRSIYNLTYRLDTSVMKQLCFHQINIYELILVCPYPSNIQMISETAYSSQIKLIGLNLHVSEHGIGYSNLTPDPQGAQGAPGVKIQVSPSQNYLIFKGFIVMNSFIFML